MCIYDWYGVQHGLVDNRNEFVIAEKGMKELKELIIWNRLSLDENI